MLDDLRNTANEDLPENGPQIPEEQIELRFPSRTRREFMGMTAPQRFTLAVLLLLMIIVLSVLCLVATNRIWV
jgi:hypothetical protein